MKKKVINVFIIFYIIISIIATLFLLSYSDSLVSHYKNYSIIPMKSDYNKLNKGSLVIVKNNNKFRLEENVYYFDIAKKIKEGKIETLEEDALMINGEVVEKDDVVGKTSSVVEIPLLGFLVMLLTSKIGYLVFIILPVLLIFIYEIYLFWRCLKMTKQN